MSRIRKNTQAQQMLGRAKLDLQIRNKALRQQREKYGDEQISTIRHEIDVQKARLEALKRTLNVLIEDERYEDAAKVRDKIPKAREKLKQKKEIAKSLFNAYYK